MAKNKYTYFIPISLDEDGNYIANFPDFPDLVADYGKNIEDCIAQSTAFLNDVVCNFVERNKEIPKPSTIIEIQKNTTENIVCVVPICVYLPAKTERINITGKGDVFAKIDDYAKAHHITRSELMINSTLEFIRAN